MKLNVIWPISTILYVHSIIISKLPKIICLIISMVSSRGRSNWTKSENNLLINLFILRSRLKFRKGLKNLYAFFWNRNCRSWIRNILRVILGWEILRISIKIVCLIMRKLLKLLPILLKELQELKDSWEDSNNRTLQWRLWYLIVRSWKECLRRKGGISRNYANLRRKVMHRDWRNLSQ